ncbi:SagB/ThcOx family dehydrogenase [Streptomyces fulvoviolaceus]|uniref:SagB/ThcOx family dehydrogenase n=1 Tax=Streptomyces fulvoviolaceus TaxID=285535 RepID=UPI0021C0D787|nr:SagB/ThcOx family dehydrogenase [Streptomyces fulvoviolaceus]MCT9076528.1 SagB/ThcOx family dehydrogenase [Streptomyces fulvoviolaceus]
MTPQTLSGTQTYVPNPTLLVYPSEVEDERLLVAETDSARPPLILRDIRVALAITLLPDRGTRADVLARWQAERVLAPIAEDLFEVLAAEGVLLPADQEPEQAAAWRRYGWEEAYRYHASTRDYPFLQMDQEGAFAQDDARMEEYVQESPPPPITMDLPAAADGSVPLRKLGADESADALLETLTADQKRGREGLSVLMDVVFGERTRRPFAVQGDFLRKAVPSGGARHPTEAFLVTFPGAPVTPGVHHYNVEHHRLDVVRAGDHSAAFREASFDLFDKFHREPFGLLVFCSLVERAMWRYRDARSARAPFIDVGHTLMAYRTVIGRLGVGGYTYQKFDDAAIAGLLGIDVTRMSPLFLGTLV